jgi:hypothetical protein
MSLGAVEPLAGFGVRDESVLNSKRKPGGRNGGNQGAKADTLSARRRYPA